MLSIYENHMNGDITTFGDILMRFLRVKKWILGREAKKVICLVCVLGVFLPAAFCGGDDHKRDCKNLMTITKGDNGTVITLREGELFRVELEALGSAGYNWYFDNLDEEHLELISKSTRAVSEGKVGAPVIGVWLMKAVQKGNTEIKMDCYRIWEGKDKATAHFSVKILVE
jgi:predicted secreted protein